MAFNISSLVSVSRANTRKVSLNYDMMYSNKTGRFTVSPLIVEKYNLKENGLTLSFDPADKEKSRYLMIQENEKSVMLKGEGRTFTSSELRKHLDDANIKTVNMSFEEVYNQDGVIVVKVIASGEDLYENDVTEEEAPEVVESTEEFA
jgi:hypothetical protein